MRAWQHRWETWAGRNLGLERWDTAFGAGQAKRLSRSDHTLSDSATKLADGSSPDRLLRGVAQSTARATSSTGFNESRPTRSCVFRMLWKLPVLCMGLFCNFW